MVVLFVACAITSTIIALLVFVAFAVAALALYATLTDDNEQRWRTGVCMGASLVALLYAAYTATLIFTTCT